FVRKLVHCATLFALVVRKELSTQAQCLLHHFVDDGSDSCVEAASEVERSHGSVHRVLDEEIYRTKWELRRAKEQDTCRITKLSFMVVR
ncbi:hypothetical protein, partial [Listeria monocytogenes]|uniref:hypothetical protein n=1 Tax=Listeria monocytogenes TaxID=1639 RepID=UPI003F67541E